MKRSIEMLLAAAVTGLMACAPEPFALPVKRVEFRDSHYRWLQLIGKVQVWHDEKVTHRYAISRDGRYCRIDADQRVSIGDNLGCAWVEPETIEWWKE